MKSIETEVKGIAKAVGASLKRAGHQVPHSVLLHALAAALDKRDWHKLKASLMPQDNGMLVTTTPAPVVQLSPFARMLLRMAFVIGRPVHPVPVDEATAVAQAVEAVGNSIVGTITFKNLSAPATLLSETGDFLVESDELNDRGIGRLSFATFRFETEKYGSFDMACQYTWPYGWALDSQYLVSFQQALEAVVPDAQLFGAKDPSEASQGPRVRAKFWTDDHRFEVDFDATPYFQKTSADTLLSIAEVGFSGDYNTDNVAEYIADHKLSDELVDGFDYLHAVQKASLRDPIGFECRVNSSDFYRWMDVYYPSELAQWLCLRAGVSIFQIDEPGTFGQWQWSSNDTACAYAFDDQEEAAVDAYKKLGLLEKALNGEL